MIWPTILVCQMIINRKSWTNEELPNTAIHKPNTSSFYETEISIQGMLHDSWGYVTDVWKIPRDCQSSQSLRRNWRARSKMANGNWEDLCRNFQGLRLNEPHVGPQNHGPHSTGPSHHQQHLVPFNTLGTPWGPVPVRIPRNYFNHPPAPK